MTGNAAYFDLGFWRRPITTTSTDAQRWFDRGLMWTYGYNQEEAAECFRRALEHDSDCAMAWWGLGYCSGPFYNRYWQHLTDPELATMLGTCREATHRAIELAGDATPAERALIHALKERYPGNAPQPLDELQRWQDNFTNAMRRVHREFPDDLDIAAIFAEAAITRTPRMLWDIRNGVPRTGADTVEVRGLLESVIERSDRIGVHHPGACHVYLHVMEMSPVPEEALPTADRLAELAPDAGHLLHMPTHIHVLCGDYRRAVTQSEIAIEADYRYLDYAGPDNFYTTSRTHSVHLYCYAAMMLGQHRIARNATLMLEEAGTPELIEGSPPYMASILDGYASMRTHVQVRFGKWDELVHEPAPDRSDLYPVTTAMRAYGRGIGHSALGNIDEARSARRELDVARARIPSNTLLLNNPANDVLAVAEAMLDGELSYRLREFDTAFERLREAVRCDDGLNFTEPWAWMHPPRHALGALLCEQGRYREAEAVYRADLGLDGSLPRCMQHPRNVWALQGLVECVERCGRTDEIPILRQELATAAAFADFSVTSSCACRGLDFPTATPPSG